MKNLWAGIKLGFQTLVANPLKYMFDPVGATSTQYRQNLEAEGLSIEEIDQAVKVYEDSGGPITDVGKAYGSFTKGVGDAIKGIGGLFSFLGKNIVGVLIVAALVVAAWYFLILRKATQ